MKDRIRLAFFSETHVGRTFEWVREPDFQRLFLMRQAPTWEGHLDYFHRVLADEGQRVYAIVEEDRHIGNGGIKNIRMDDHSGELWVYIGDHKDRGKGAGSRATELLLQEGFRNLGLRTVYVHVADFNEQAVRMYRRLGFTESRLLGNDEEWMDRGCTVIRMEARNDS
ncbi:MAG: GNAT family N-acetyltransferase [Syntrophaceae bacterium]|nr:GNAT family N-acetyltransferase [Syntrophaceae bacterium]